MMLSNSCNTHTEVGINRTKFDVCIPKSFGGVKAHVRKYIYIFVTLVGCNDVMTSPTHHDNHPGVIINRAKFNVGRPNSF